MDTQVNFRVREILDHSTLSPTEFSSAVGISRSNLAHILSGRNQPGFAMLEKILKAFPEIRGEWLITGMGNMIKSESELKELHAAQEKTTPPAPVAMELPFDEVPDTPENTEATDTYEELNPSVNAATATLISTRRSGRGQRNPLAHNNGKKVKKIVYFYTDNSFEEYYPL